MKKELIILKCGGAYLTIKSKHQTLAVENLNSLIEIMKYLINRNYQIILIIGAGSFGHFEAKQYKITSGFNDGTDINSREGMIATRFSVLKLLDLVCKECQKNNIFAMPVSPFDSWNTKDDAVVLHNSPLIQSMLNLSLIPVLHGDVCMDQSKGCTILSGDTIIQVLAEHLKPKRVIFITDVDGVYDKSPSEPNANLIPHIKLTKNNNQQPDDSQNLGKQHDDINNISTKSNLDHDVTGGMKAKLQSAIKISSMDIDVLIIGGNSSSILSSPNFLENKPSNIGTIITVE